ncbi:MAG: phosphoribosylformylglycinamidine synthase subunit PurS [Planctomycetota bacterium]|jgi:phosphoribosylformylglycinamidine synthase
MSTVHRIEVRPKSGQPDPAGEAACRDAGSFGLPDPPRRIDAAQVYLIEADLPEAQLRRVAEELLADPVTQDATLGATPPRADALIEVHPLPGVMDPDAEAVETAIREMLGVEVAVRTGRRYDLHGTPAAAARELAERCLANTVIHAIHDEPYHPAGFPGGGSYELRVRTVPIGDLDDDGLQRLSREAHLFLSLEEMRAIVAHYRDLGRDPREIELETLAQTWSEHCVHKTLRATIEYRGPLPDGPVRTGFRPGSDGAITITNLLKSTIVAATERLIAGGADWCLSVFVDNAGVVAFDDRHAVCFKVETHNHPSAIEPYGGAATGIGGCIRDIIGTGLAARPIAATDVFCVAHPDHGEPPAGCLHPRRILTQVVAGVRDYGNRMGIPTLNGAVWFDDDYVGNPLVYCGCVGVMPRDRVHGSARPGDRIVALGGRTGRDGIHGATFSSAELTDTHADEFSHAVQIGNAVTEKKLLDAILAARDHESGCLFHAITDCGAGGFSSAVGEMGEVLGAEVHLERAPLKYAGLSPTEIWISEAQERMVLAVPAGRLDDLRAVCEVHDVELCDLGAFGTEGRELILNYDGTEVGRMSMAFLHDGLPRTVRCASWREAPATEPAGRPAPPALGDALVRLLGHPNIASKHWIIRQYDHEVQGGSVVKPLVGPRGRGPSDAAVVRPVAGSSRGLAIANGLATGLRHDPYVMTLAAIDECVRNLVCVGADPRRVALLDNFCWPGCDDPEALGGLVRAATACADGAIAYRAPFISGKDSLNNQFTAEDGRTIRIPPTLLISGFAIVPDTGQCVTMDAKRAGNILALVGPPAGAASGGSHYRRCFDDGNADPAAPAVDLELGPAAALAVHQAITGGLVASAHDCSDGGLLVAAAEMAFAGELGLSLDPGPALAPLHDGATIAAWFAESPSRYLLEIPPERLPALRDLAADVHAGLIVEPLGTFDDSGRLTCPARGLDVPVADLERAWRQPLDW